MAVAKLRSLGWQYPSVDPYTGEPLDDEDIADMLTEQAKESAAAADPFSASLAGGDAGGDPFAQDQQAPQDQTIDLGMS